MFPRIILKPASLSRHQVNLISLANIANIKTTTINFLLTSIIMSANKELQYPEGWGTANGCNGTKWQKLQI